MEEDVAKGGIKQAWPALHNKSSFISCFFFLLCYATVPNHYTPEKFPLRQKLKPKGSKIRFKRYLELLFTDVIALCCNAFVPFDRTYVLQETVFRYMQHTFPFFNNYFITFRKCWSGFLWMLPKEDNKMFINLAWGIPSVHTFCSTHVIPTTSFLCLNSGGRHKLHKTQEEILTVLDYKFQS